MDKQKTLKFAELIIIFFIVVILLSTVIVTYINFTKNYNYKSTKENYFTIISIINSEKENCSKGSNKWVWNDEVTIICGSILLENHIGKFFNNTIKLKNPYDKEKAVYEVSSIPDILKPGVNYVILNQDNNTLKINTLLKYDGKLLETIKHFK